MKVLGAWRVLGKLILVFFGLCLAFIAIVILINAFDESPSPELEAATSQNRWARDWEDGNGYFYLLGFASPAGSEPARVAQGVVEHYNEHIDADYRELSLSDLMNDLGGLTLTGDAALLCDWQESDCLAHFERHAEGFDKLASDNALLLERYDALIHHPDYRPAIKPSYMEPYLADASLPGYAQQLMFYTVFVNGNGKPGTEVIDVDLAFWRRVLENTDIMPDKALAAQLVRNNAAFRSATDARNGTDFTASLSPLKPIETDLEPVLRRELHGALWAVEQFDRFGVETTPRWAGSPLGRYFLKPTASKNLLADYYARMIEIFAGDPGTWRSSLDDLERSFDRKTGGIGRLYNPVGKLYFLRNVDAYADFGMRLVNLDAYLARGRPERQLASEVPDEDMVKCKRLTFDPLLANVPFCTRVMDRPNLPDDVRIEALSARAQAFIAATTYKSDHDVTVKQLRSFALADLDEAIALVRETGDRERLPPLLNQRGDRRWMTGDYEGALEDYNEFLVGMEVVAFVLGSRAMMFEKQGHYDEAIRDMTAAIRLAGPAGCSNLHNWVLQRGEMHEAAGDLAAAQRDYQITLGADPAHIAAKAALERIGVDPEQVRGIDELPTPPTCNP